MTGKKIFIAAPEIIESPKGARLVAGIAIDGEKKDVWVEVERKYANYLCSERSDAFVIGLLHYAMCNGYDIECETPITAQLAYQIRTYLVPSLVRRSKVLHATRIEATLEEVELANAGGVGTGISCGVDSLHAVMNHANSEYPEFKLTHLVLNNVGAYWRGKDDNQYAWQMEHARSFCNEYGFELILVDSNYGTAFRQSHLFSNVYANCFAVHSLKKLWRTFFIGSVGHDFSHFSIDDAEKHDSAYYDLLSLDVFSTRSLKIYSEGGAVDRYDKTKALVGYAPSYKYLHVCAMDNGPNCGHCRKCLRTLTTLDALDSLDKYGNVFDIQEYRRNWNRNMLWLYRQQVSKTGDSYTARAYEILRSRIGAFRLMLYGMYVFAAEAFGKAKKIIRG